MKCFHLTGESISLSKRKAILMEPLCPPVGDVLDLHTFRPAEIADLLDDYFAECQRLGIHAVRLIHGKGSGILRERVHGLLRRDPRVVSFRLAPPEAGGWGATLVDLLPPESNANP